MKDRETHFKEYEEDLKKASMENSADTLKQNLMLLSNINLFDFVNDLKKRNEDLTNLIVDLLDLLQLDDSIVNTIMELDEDIEYEDIVGVVSSVRNWNNKGCFKTLAKDREQLLEELLGKKVYRSKFNRASKAGFKHSKKKSGLK